MATVGIRATAWDGLRDNQRAIMRWGVARLALGTPARFTDGTDEWFVFDDWRFDLDQIAILGALAVAVSGLPVAWEPPTIITYGFDGIPTDTGKVDRKATEAEVIAFVSPTVVWPDDITYDVDDPNRWQTTLDAQGAPASLRAAASIPAGFIRVPSGMLP